MTGRRLLITGGSGYLGGALTHWAAAQGYAVRATWLNNRPADCPGVHWEMADLRKGEELSALVNRVSPEVVIHTAYSQNDRSVTYDGTVLLAGACSRLDPPPFFIFVSTDLVYDGRAGGYSEADEPVPLLDYGRDKLDAEQAVRQTLPGALVVRSSLMYDLERLPGHLRFATEKVARGESCVFFADEYRSPVLVNELARAILDLAGRRQPGLLHLAGPDRVSRLWLGTHLLRAFGYPTDRVKPGSSRESGMLRPADCSLDSTQAEKILGRRFTGAVEVLKKYDE
ncbi:MAG: hypothetical protein A3F83_15075 [Candidatus Glassbacteria bacterium RIFCSPLOWO2_12_FULL_58_11]|uniref:RmlD-like substrate binding domain-containing protein n=1 Tax=Candidatus Glassbacteria bacterium RIFCSPLOWO2_12_FULL_58_11 TaxID=1817867 RepID=A0A1F5YMH5_9BACT|nr:MAG: hypothetical protein A3F83_15075 [Candidatus Glassbacteria bacterium RIFCSPLOWO2_12_FULL_58_11]